MFKFTKQKFNQRRRSELAPVPKTIQTILLDNEESAEFIGPSTSSPRRHSLPACITDKTLIDHLTEQALCTIDEVNLQAATAAELHLLYLFSASQIANLILYLRSQWI
jgi:hypothetical protein